MVFLIIFTEVYLSFPFLHLILFHRLIIIKASQVERRELAYVQTLYVLSKGDLHTLFYLIA